MKYLIGLIGLVGFMLTGPLSYQEGYAQQAEVVSDERLVPLVSINENTISLGVFKKSYVDYLIATGANDTEAHRQLHLQALIDAYLIGDDARQKGRDRDTKFAQFSEHTRKKALGGRYYELEVLDQVDTLSDEEKRVAYAKYNSKVHVRQLSFSYEKEAEKYHERLQQGEDFIDLANEVFQTAAYDSSAGDMGFIAYFEVDDAIAEAAFQLDQQYEYSRPVRSRSGYHILRLEDKHVSPILSEYAYQAHGKGVGEDMQLRKIRIQGDAFVRSFMDSLQYVIDPDAAKILTQQIRDMLVPDEALASLVPGQAKELSLLEEEKIRTILSPQTPLVRYQWKGEAQVFTAGHYFQWLQDLPYAELKSNTVASIGRALRNEVMGLAGKEAGLDDDPIVKESLLFEEQVYLSSKTKEMLRQDTTITPTEDMVRSAFNRLTHGRKKSIQVDYWKILTASMEDAQIVLNHISENGADPTHFTRYQSFSDIDIFLQPEWMSHLRQAPLLQPILVGLKGGQWAVFEVTKRAEIPYEFLQVRSSLEKQLAPYAGEYFLLQKLYHSAVIDVDHSLLDQWPTK